MIVNFWRPYPLLKPKEEGWYQCTVGETETGNLNVMDLYYRAWDDVWIDERRQSVFDGYKCYKSGREPLEYNRCYGDSLCIRNDVIAWKKLPRKYR